MSHQVVDFSAAICVCAFMSTRVNVTYDPETNLAEMLETLV